MRYWAQPPPLSSFPACTLWAYPWGLCQAESPSLILHWCLHCWPQRQWSQRVQSRHQRQTQGCCGMPRPCGEILYSQGRRWCWTQTRLLHPPEFLLFTWIIKMKQKTLFICLYQDVCQKTFCTAFEKWLGNSLSNSSANENVILKNEYNVKKLFCQLNLPWASSHNACLSVEIHYEINLFDEEIMFGKLETYTATTEIQERIHTTFYTREDHDC